MSVHLVLTKTSRNGEISVPIATEAFFLKAWRPLALECSLYFVTEMQSGYDIDQATLIRLVEELKIMLAHAGKAAHLTQEEAGFFTKRLMFILEKTEGEASFAGVQGWVA